MEQLEKLWNAKRIYQEPICFSETENGSIIGGQLLFTPDRVESVTSNDGATVYQEGRDYRIEGSQLQRTSNSRIPVLPRDAYRKPYDGAQETAWLRLPGGKSYLAIFPEVVRYQLCVTYSHHACWDDFVPPDGSAVLSRSMQKLATGGAFRLVFYGDSITAGWEASGCDEEVIDMRSCQPFHLKISRPPYLPSWAELVTRQLHAEYPQAEIQKINRGAGGSTTEWGVAHAKELVCPHAPDLLILAFGMNSLCDSASLYKSQMESIIDTVQSQNSDCDVLLISPMTPSLEIAGFLDNTLAQQEDALFEIAKDRRGIAVAPVHRFCEALLRRGKTYYELTGNCINHPNDFSVRVYAQTVLAAMGL